MKPGLVAGGLVAASARLVLKNATLPSTAVLLSAATPPAHWIRTLGSGIVAENHGSTQARSVAVRTLARASWTLLAPEARLRIPQPAPSRVSNGTTRSWVTSMTESTTPPVPQ
jgi:hypothetical protein